MNNLYLSADVLLVSVSDIDTDNYRKTSKKVISILLEKREKEPFKGMWDIPGLLLNDLNDTLFQCANRVLRDKVGIKDNIYLEQLYTFDRLNRDPKRRVITTSYIALIDKNKLTTQPKNTCWFNVEKYTNNSNCIKLELTNGEEKLTIDIKKKLVDKTSSNYDYISNEKPSLAFSNDTVVAYGLDRLKNKISYTDLAFNLVGETFTLGELQQVYEVILNKKLLDPAFRRVIKNKVKRTDILKTGEGHRPSYMFKYRG